MYRLIDDNKMGGCLDDRPRENKFKTENEMLIDLNAPNNESAKKICST